MKPRQLFAVACLICAFSGTLRAQYGLPTFTANDTAATTTVVGFGGQQWYVVTDNSGAATPSIRLLHKDSGYGNSEFRKFDGGWDGTMNHGSPNEYGDSTLQRKMESLAEALPSGEAAQLIARTGTDLSAAVIFSSGDNDTWVTIADQKLWAISYNEWNDLSTDMKKYGNNYWLRSPLEFDINYALVGSSGGGYAGSRMRLVSRAKVVLGDEDRGQQVGRDQFGTVVDRRCGGEGDVLALLQLFDEVDGLSYQLVGALVDC